MKPLQECFLSDVRVSKEVRHFGGVVNESDNFTFYRFFGILLKQEALEQFEELCQFVQDMRFERLGCFAYSQEEGTAAAEFEDQIDEDIKERRAEIVMETQMRISDEFNQQCLGRTFEVVCEGFDRYAECYYGRTAMDAPEIDGKVFFTSEDKVQVGQYVNVLTDDTLDYDLIGSVAEKGE